MRVMLIGLTIVGLEMSGCASYVTPGPPADFEALGITPADAAVATDGGVLIELERRPLATLPATIAIARLQGRSYVSKSSWGYGSGHTTLVTIRDVESDEALARLRGLPSIGGMAPMNRLVVDAEIRSEKDIRRAAARLHAEMTLLYTIDTRFGERRHVPFMTVLSLGLLPTREATVTSVASAILLDTRTGYVYGLAEAHSEVSRQGTSWNTSKTVDRARLEAERRAFDDLVGEIESMWLGVAHTLEQAGARAES